jgi:DNA-binding PadR family transcriptional regulator
MTPPGLAWPPDLIDSFEEMASRGHLENLELVILLAIMRVGDEAYGVSISDEIEKTTGRTVVLGSVYAALERLEGRGLVTSRLGEPRAERGGRAPRHFRITASGLREVRAAQKALTALWRGLPRLRRARMTRGSSGRLWCWLIERLAVAPHRDAMIGDLIEQSRRGRSTTWWARQASAIIIGSLAREIVRRPGFVGGALLLGFATAAVTGNVARFSPDMATVFAVGVVFLVCRPIRVPALVTLALFVSSMHLAAVSFVVMSLLGHFGGLEFLIREGLRHFSLPVLLGATLLALALAARQPPDESPASPPAV